MTLMRRINELERAARELPPQELAEFREWFAGFDAAQWDRQFERDVAAGRLDALAQEALKRAWPKGDAPTCETPRQPTVEKHSGTAHSVY